MARLTTLILAMLCLLSYQEGHAQSAAEQKIRGLAIQQVLSFCSECETVVENKWVPSELGRMDSSNIVQLAFKEVGLPKGYQTADVVFIKDGKSQTKQVQLYIQVKKKLPVSNKRIQRTQTISSGDLSFKTIDITRLREFPIASKEKIAGQAAGSLIPKGSVIMDSDLRRIPVVEVGDNVQMVYRKGGVEVALNCIARQARAKGEPIRVYSKETRKTYIGKVVTPSKVIWEKTL